MAETIHSRVQQSPFRNVYWFARYLLNTDQYGAMGKIKERQLLNIVTMLETLIAQEHFSDENKLILLKNTLAGEITAMINPNTKAHTLSMNLVNQLEQDLMTVEDVSVFCIAMKYVVAPINRAIALVPADDKNFVKLPPKISLTHLAKKRLVL